MSQHKSILFVLAAPGRGRLTSECCHLGLKGRREGVCITMCTGRPKHHCRFSVWNSPQLVPMGPTRPCGSACPGRPSPHPLRLEDAQET